MLPGRTWIGRPIRRPVFLEGLWAAPGEGNIRESASHILKRFSRPTQTVLQDIIKS